MKEQYSLVIFMLLGNLAHGIYFQASTVIDVAANLTCSVTETNIRAVLLIRISVKPFVRGGSEDQIEPRVVAVATSDGIKLAGDAPPGLGSIDVAGHLDDAYFSKSYLAVGFNLTNQPCEHYDAIYTCEIYYLDLKHSTITENADKTLTTTCEIAAGQSSDSAVHRYQLGVVFIAGCFYSLVVEQLCWGYYNHARVFP